MKSLKLTLFLLSLSGVIFAQVLSVKDLTVDHKVNPIGIDNKYPRFSWKIGGTGNNILQTAYSVRVATDEKFSASKIVWQSDKVESDESILRSYLHLFLFLKESLCLLFMRHHTLPN